MPHDPDDRFGMPESAVAAAQASHGLGNPVMRMGMYVPTRREVASLPADDLMFILDCWLYESPTELIPSRAQVRHVREVLMQRPDCGAGAIRELIGLCDACLEPKSGGGDPQ